jgi:hypothetical protein
MKPEDIFKIEDSSEIPADNYQKEEPSKEEESSNKNPINEKKEFNLTDLMDLLKKNKIDADTSLVEKTYNNIVLEKKEKESITNIIKELKKEETAIKENAKSNDGGGGENIKSLDSKIKELSDKIANLNVSEREKEDNIKAHVNNIFKSEKNENVNLDKSSNNNQINVKNEILQLINNEISDGKKTNAVESLKNPESSLNSVQTSKNPESSLNSVQTSKNPESTLNSVESLKNPESISNSVQTSKNPESSLNSVESLKNPESSLNSVESLKNPESNIFGKDSQLPPQDVLQSNTSVEKINSQENTPTSSNIENLKSSESISKNENIVEGLKKIESEIPEFKGNDDNKSDNSSDFKKIHESIGKMSDLMIKGFSNLGENMGSLKSKNSELSNAVNEPPQMSNNKQDSGSSGGNPTTIQKNYIDEYRKSLRNDLPLKSLMGISTKLKGNNIGSFI